MTQGSASDSVLIAIPVLLIGGTEIQSLAVVRVLVKAHYRVLVCCYYEFDESVINQFKRAGAEVILLGMNRKNGLFKLGKQLFKLFRELRPDIVHVQYLAPGLIPVMAARLAGVSTVFATVHIAGSIAYGRKAKFMLRMAARLCTAFFCVSRGVEEFWFGNSEVLNPEDPNNKRKHFTIYNAIDVEKIERIVGGVDREELKRSLQITGKKVVGIVGRLAPQKGHVVLLDAMNEVIKQNPNVILVAIGDGPNRDKLEDKAMELGITKHIHWMGAMKQEEVFQLYGIMDILAIPSLYEGFGLTATEAMAAGLPVVGTRVDGLSEIIEDGATGYILPVSDSQGLANVLIQMLLNPEEREMMGLRAKDRVQKLFSLERFNRSVLAAYANLSSH